MVFCRNAICKRVYFDANRNLSVELQRLIEMPENECIHLFADDLQLIMLRRIRLSLSDCK